MSKKNPSNNPKGLVTSAETKIAKELFMLMWSKIQKPDKTADGNRIVAIISTMIATAAITVRPEDEMSETIDAIAAEAKRWADRAPVSWENK